MQKQEQSSDQQSATPFFATLLKDPLSEVTRKERLYLLASSILGIIIVKTGLIPTRITTLGITFEKANQDSLVFVLGLVVLYFLVTFLVYAAGDFAAWMETYQLLASDQHVRDLEAYLNREAAIRLEQRSQTSQMNKRELIRQVRQELLQELEHQHNFPLDLADFFRVKTLYAEGEPTEIKFELGQDIQMVRNKRMLLPIATLRSLLEYVLPILVGAYATILLIFGSTP
jgi:hypothetical protein